MKLRIVINALLLAMGLLFEIFTAGCGGESDDADNIPTDDGGISYDDGGNEIFPQDPQAAQAFPAGLAVASPLKTVENTQIAQSIYLSGGIAGYQAGLDEAWSTGYEYATAQIDSVLNGTSEPADVFDPELFFRLPTKADCFGPQVVYHGHPDHMGGGGSPDGNFPTGDLGIWTETDNATPEACAAAEVNGLIGGMSDQSRGALVGLASLISVAAKNSVALPEAGSEIDLTESMNAEGITNVTFSNATLSHADSGAWEYTLEFEYTKMMNAKSIFVTLTHTPNADDASIYSGLLYYRISGNGMDFQGGNCQLPDRTLNGSLKYERTGETDLKVQSRIATYCGADIDARITDTAHVGYGLIDPALKAPTPNGWSENFHLFVANLDPTENSGAFAYAWQAGGMDSHSRVFNIGINANTPLDGEAYYGYGASVENTDGSIAGMICNWAGPGNMHNPIASAQRQAVEFNSSEGVFTQPTDGADITYAPTNSCEYDGSGTFTYDKNVDGDDTDPEEAANVAVAADLLEAATGTIAEAIAARGFTIPTAPGGWPAE